MRADSWAAGSTGPTHALRKPGAGLGVAEQAWSLSGLGWYLPWAGIVQFGTAGDGLKPQGCIVSLQEVCRVRRAQAKPCSCSVACWALL